MNKALCGCGQWLRGVFTLFWVHEQHILQTHTHSSGFTHNDWRKRGLAAVYCASPQAESMSNMPVTNTTTSHSPSADAWVFIYVSKTPNSVKVHTMLILSALHIQAIKINIKKSSLWWFVKNKSMGTGTLRVKSHIQWILMAPGDISRSYEVKRKVCARNSTILHYYCNPEPLKMIILPWTDSFREFDSKNWFSSEQLRHV